MKKISAISIQKKATDTSFFLALIKGSLIALCISLIGILIFAFILKFATISDGAIRPINQVIKGISIFFGVLLGMRKINKMGLIGGLIIGIIYTVIAFVVFSILDGGFSFDLTLLNDTTFSSVIGAICGILTVNFKKK